MLRPSDPGRRGATAPPDVPFAALRTGALDAAEEGQPVKRAHRNVRGVVVDVPANGGYVTIVALADDTTSMYTSTGGGTIGAGTHPEVATATHQLLSRVQAQLGDFPHREDRSLPRPGTIRLHVASSSGPRVADVPEDCFWGEMPHALSPVLASVQRVLSAIREVSPNH